MDMYIITPALVCIVHIGVSVIVYSWSGVLLEPSVSRISVNNVRAFVFVLCLENRNLEISISRFLGTRKTINQNINHLKVAPDTDKGIYYD